MKPATRPTHRKATQLAGYNCRPVHRLVLTASVAALMAAGCSTTHSSSLAISTLHATTASNSSPPCKAALLFAAAEAQLHLTTDPSKYPPEPGQGPGAYGPVCYEGWAIATISHPAVGTSDGGVLFRDENGRWVYFAGVGGVPADCVLEKLGVPSAVATILWPSSGSANASYCSQGG
jgi:hypothetical protein